MEVILMGFFDRKVICGVCDEEVGLNRYKLKKSDAWICPKCLKGAGGLTVINVRKSTVEEIKEIIKEKRTAQAERLNGDPMSTAEGMYKYCKDKNFGTGFNEKWALKHFRIIENNLMQDEKVLMTFIGLHNYVSATKHDNTYSYALTNKRIMFAQKTITGENFKAVNYDKLNDVGFKKGMVYGIVTIDTLSEIFNVALDRDSATAINNHIHKVLDDLKDASIAPQPQFVYNTSAADEIKKYKELLDIEAITQEEFDIKKKELLGL
ncbi:PH domain-containing protein [Priestia aryabhattai]|uniref:PH domain-containing protein n=1 Tax=Priestia aryabhattai TaxID=412384 RepID=UPI002E1A9650